MPIHKPGIIQLLFGSHTNLSFWLHGKCLGNFDREYTLKQVPIDWLVLANGDVCLENNYTTPRTQLNMGINERNVTVLSYHLKNAYFSNGCIDLLRDCEKIRVLYIGVS